MTAPIDPESPRSTRRGVPDTRHGVPEVDPLAPGGLSSSDPVVPADVRTPSGAEAGSSTGAVQDKARDVAGQAQDKAREAAGQARGRLTDQVDQRSTQAGQEVSSTAGDVRSVAQELRNQGKDRPARIAEQVADRGERLGSYLERSDAERILQDIEDFGRRQPWAVMAGGLALGFLASRFLKASSRNRYETYRSTYRPPIRPLPSETGTGYAATPTGAGYAAAPVGESFGPGAPLDDSFADDPTPPPLGPRSPRFTSEPPPVPAARPEDEPGRRGTAGRP